MRGLRARLGVLALACAVSGVTAAEASAAKVLIYSGTVAWHAVRRRFSVARTMPVNKSLQDQMDEIKELIASASATLRQASWAMETLTTRLAEASPEPTADSPGPAQPEPAAAVPAGSANGTGEPPALNTRHLRWRRGSGA